MAALAATFSVAVAEKPGPTYAAYVVDTSGKALGTVTFMGVNGGTQIRVDLSGLPPGRHGMHIHEFGSCNPLRDTEGKVTPFGAAGGHFDPMNTKTHLGPDANGHAGDLPMLEVNYAGIGQSTFFIKSLSVAGPNSIVGKSIVIHANPDNYTDTPPNGGSGGRIACGEIGALRTTM
jgi:Cu-Zn family superoxide dismutase